MVACGWSGYLQDSLNLPTSVFGEDSVINLGAVFIVVVLGAVAAVGIRESKWVTNSLVVVKVTTSDDGLYGLGCATFTQRWRAVVSYVEDHLARARRHVTGQAVEEGRLAGAVRPDQADDFTLRDRQAGVAHGEESAKLAGYVFGFKQHGATSTGEAKCAASIRTGRRARNARSAR